MAAPPPDDIMLLVFEHAVRIEGAEAAWPGMAYDHNAAKAPFAVAGVCRRWRELALSTSTLWTYFGFPPADEMHKLHLQRAELLRLRAGSAPVDVVFGWRTERYTMALRNDTARLVFDVIINLGSRWKNAVLHVSRGWKVEHLFQNCQWTVLEQLSLAIDAVPSIVPAAPRLHKFWLDCDRCLVDEPFIVAGYPSLRMFSLFCDSLPLVRRFGPAFGTQLTELVLIDDVGRLAARGMGPRFTFPALRLLTIDDGRWLQHVDAPVLTSLTLTHVYIEGVTVYDTLRRFDHVTTLGICGEFYQNRQLQLLKDLPNITTLSFYCPTSLAIGLQGARDYYHLGPGMLRALAQLEPPIWPRLQRLYFEPFAPGVKSDEDVVYAKDLIEFVVARNARLDGTSRIVEAVANYPDAPDWLNEKLREVVAAGA